MSGQSNEICKLDNFYRKIHSNVLLLSIQSHRALAEQKLDRNSLNKFPNHMKGC